MWRKFIYATAILALLSGTALAQMSFSPFAAQQNRRGPTQEEIDKQKALDDQYKNATKKIPDKTVSDPWATVRTAPQASSQSKKQQ
jgi:hypothetical protein